MPTLPGAVANQATSPHGSLIPCGGRSVWAGVWVPWKTGTLEKQSKGECRCVGVGRVGSRSQGGLGLDESHPETERATQAQKLT